MSSPTTSLVPISSAKAIEAAHLMLASVERARQKEREEEIQRWLKCNRWVKWSWRGRKTGERTRQEAEQAVDAATMDSPNWHMCLWRCRGNHYKVLADRLLSTAPHAEGGVVWLNLEDADDVLGYLPK